MKITHSTTAPGAYEIKADDVLVGHSTKTDKGKFNFTPIDGAVKQGFTDVKTMRDLKVEVARAVSKAYVEANKPAKPEKPAKEPKPSEEDAAEGQIADAGEAAESGEDITLD